MEPGFKLLSARDFDPNAPGYKTRPVRKKTRTGCLPCKAKKVKCDEAKPACIRCQRNSRCCAYGPVSSSSGSLIPGNDYGHPLSSSSPSPFSALISAPSPFSTPNAPRGTPSRHLMQHFLGHWDDIFPMAPNDAMIELTKSNALVRNAILAMTACHLRHLRPDLLRHRVADHFHQLLAIHGCRELLATPAQEMDQSSVDLLLLGSSLLNMLALVEQPEAVRMRDGDDAGSSDGYESQMEISPTPESATTLNPAALSWALAPPQDRVDWMSLHVALRGLGDSMQACIPNTLSFLAGVLLDDSTATWALAAVHQGFDGVPAHWRRIFGFMLDDDDDDDEENNAPGDCAVPGPRLGDVYRAPVIVLARLRTIEPLDRNVFHYLQFLGKMYPEFRDLVGHLDERAVWVLGYWLGLMCRFERLWWCKGMMARGRHLAILRWLRQRRLGERPGEEGRMWEVMMGELEAAAQSYQGDLQLQRSPPAVIKVVI